MSKRLERLRHQIERTLLGMHISTNCAVCGELATGVFPSDYIVEDERRVWEGRTHRHCASDDQLSRGDGAPAQAAVLKEVKMTASTCSWCGHTGFDVVPVGSPAPVWLCFAHITHAADIRRENSKMVQQFPVVHCICAGEIEKRCPIHGKRGEGADDAG